MAGRRRLERKTEERRPVVADDFIYDDPSVSGPDSGDLQPESDTPEEALRKMKRRRKADSADDSLNISSPDPVSAESGAPVSGLFTTSSGMRLDENLMPVEDSDSSGKNKGRKKNKTAREGTIPGWLRIIILVMVTVCLFAAVTAYVLNNLFGIKQFGVSENAISSVVSPVQDFFSGVSETLFGYFRSMKLRANIENEYNDLRAKYEEVVYKAMQADDLRQQLSKYEGIQKELTANLNLDGITCKIKGKSDGNYFSTLEIDQGSKDGIAEMMPVVYNGWLVGIVVSVSPNHSVIRTIIDSEASVHAVIQNSRRDQGMVHGTLGSDIVTGEKPMCKMFYLPDNSLPRPGDLVVTSGVGVSFPFGIPIGTVVESTRGMEANKQYVVVEPGADFQHLEEVIVFRYRNPAKPVEVDESDRTQMEIDPVDSPWPSPDVPEVANSLFDKMNETPTPNPELTPTPSPSPTPADTPTPEPSATPSPVPGPTKPFYSYQVVRESDEPTPSPTPTIQPTYTPYVSPDPYNMNWEDE